MKKCLDKGVQHMLFLGVSETPKTRLQSGSIKVAMPGSIRVGSDRKGGDRAEFQFLDRARS
jgi:hypothetical protein